MISRFGFPYIKQKRPSNHGIMSQAFSPINLTLISKHERSKNKNLYPNIFLIRLMASPPSSSSSSEYGLAGLFLGRCSFKPGRDEICLCGGGLLICWFHNTVKSWYIPHQLRKSSLNKLKVSLAWERMKPVVSMMRLADLVLFWP